MSEITLIWGVRSLVLLVQKFSLYYLVPNHRLNIRVPLSTETCRPNSSLFTTPTESAIFTVQSDWSCELFSSPTDAESENGWIPFSWYSPWERVLSWDRPSLWGRASILPLACDLAPPAALTPAYRGRHFVTIVGLCWGSPEALQKGTGEVQFYSAQEKRNIMWQCVKLVAKYTRK